MTRLRPLGLALLLTCCHSSSGITGDTHVDTPPADTIHDTVADTATDDGPAWECTEDEDCDDGDPCTVNGCDPDTHECTVEEIHGLSLVEPAVQITDDPHMKSGPRMLWTGSEIGAVWSDGRIGGCTVPWGTTYCNREIFFSRVSSTLEVLTGDVRLSNSEATSNPSSMIWTGSEYIVAWHEHERIFEESWMTRVAGDGTEIGSEVQPAGWDQAWFPSLAWTGSEIASSWSGTDEPAGSPTSMHLTRFDPSLIEIGSTLVADTGWYNTGFLWTGSEFGVISQGYDSSYYRLGPVGEAIGAPIDLGTRYPENPHLYWTGSDVAAFWTGNLMEDDPCEPHTYPTCQNLFMARIDPEAGVVSSVTLLTETEHATRISSVAWTGSEYGISWYDETGWEHDVNFTRLAPDGTRLAEDLPLPIPSTLVWTGSEYVLGWSEDKGDGFNIYMTRTITCE